MPHHTALSQLEENGAPIATEVEDAGQACLKDSTDIAGASDAMTAAAFKRKTSTVDDSEFSFQ
jgi:hypothetical protein